MNEVITIGVDLAKNVFQVHGVDPKRTFQWPCLRSTLMDWPSASGDITDRRKRCHEPPVLNPFETCGAIGKPPWSDGRGPGTNHKFELRLKSIVALKLLQALINFRPSSRARLWTEVCYDCAVGTEGLLHHFKRFNR